MVAPSSPPVNRARLSPTRVGGPPFSRAFAAARAGDETPAAAAFRLARRWYLEGRRLDMRALARDLGVSRQSLYRWTGGREQLLGDVIWSLAEEIVDRAVQEASGRGAARIVDATRRVMEALVAAPALRRFLATEASTALRVLTRPGGPVQGRLVETVTRLLEQEVAAGALELRLEPTVVAYAIVRVVEAFLYNDAIAVLEPDMVNAPAVISLLLD